MVDQVHYEPKKEGRHWRRFVRIVFDDLSIVRFDGGKRKNFADEDNFDCVEYKAVGKKV